MYYYFQCFVFDSKSHCIVVYNCTYRNNHNIYVSLSLLWCCVNVLYIKAQI
jgi:hypothetical protein